MRGGSGTVSNTASAMNASVPSEPTSRRRKISSGVVGVEERAQPVAGRVLDLELAPRPARRARRRRAARRGSATSPAASSGSAAAKRSLGVGRGRVDHRARRRARTSASATRRVGVPRRRRSACRPSCWRSRRRRVAMSVLAGSGPSLRPWRASTRLTWPSTVPGRTRTRAPPSSTRDAGEVAADVDEDPVGLRLPVEARAAGAEDERRAGARARRRSPARRRRRRAPSRRPSGSSR